LDLTATTNASIGANASIVISGTTAGMAPPSAGVSIIIEPTVAAKYEIIGSANWSIVDGTHISFTATKTHTQPYTVRQHGAAFFDMGQFVRFNSAGPQSYVSFREHTDTFDFLTIKQGTQSLTIR